MTTLANNPALDITGDRYHRNDAPAKLIEIAVERGEGKLAQNGTLVVSTGDRTGRSPKDKYLEDTPGVHDKIWWGAINQPMTPEKFDRLEQIANEYYEGLKDVFVFDGYVGADPDYRLRVRALTQYAWHALFAQTLFITPSDEELKTFENDWTIINCANRKITAEEAAEL
ncbi:MAG: phosphoenolpyruvate carboxykinase (ATP), partial [Planctomycetota bacterium]